ncbi:MAG: hypothetical protein R6W66_04615 [Pelovirga sp.]
MLDANKSEGVQLKPVTGKRIRQKKIINLINSLHYQEKPLLLSFYHLHHDYYLTAKALPGPVTDQEVQVTLLKDETFPASLAAFDLQKVTLPMGLRSYVFVPENVFLSDEDIQFTLPDQALDDLSRSHQRFSCQSGLFVTLTQNALSFPGCLLDFSPRGMLIELMPDDNWNPSWLNPQGDATLVVMKGGQNVYSGAVSLSAKESPCKLLLRPQDRQFSRYTPKHHRARRESVSPSPEAVFCHPITGAQCSLKIADIGSLGFAIQEKQAESVLLPGLILPEVQVHLASNLIFSCLAQVVYSRPEADSGLVRSGLAILNIDMAEHLKLIKLVQQSQDENSYVSNQVDPDDLFRFFFETGFIYPAKYAEISQNKAEFHRTYSSLYQRSMDISRHFVYQSAGQIQGHFASLRVYRKTWINQHHAAIQNHRAGLRVVRAISEYLNDSYRLDPTNIRYIIGYYRPNNKFPRHFFGEYVKNTQDQKQTSLDELAYFHDASHFRGGETLPEPWSLTPATPADIALFSAFYRNHSGGLMPQALDLTSENYCHPEISETYAAHGLKRTRELFALRYAGNLQALVDVQNSDAGLNLSEITNAISFYFLSWQDPQAAKEAMDAVIARFVTRYQKQKHPVMIYPMDAAKAFGLNPDKSYVLWVLDIVTGSESYMDWLNKFCR